MTKSIEISPRLERWPTLADYTLTPGTDSDDGRPTFWSPGGEVRYFVGANGDNWFIVTDSDRLGAERFLFAACSMDIVEKYFLVSLVNLSGLSVICPGHIFRSPRKKLRRDSR